MWWVDVQARPRQANIPRRIPLRGAACSVPCASASAARDEGTGTPRLLCKARGLSTHAYHVGAHAKPGQRSTTTCSTVTRAALASDKLLNRDVEIPLRLHQCGPRLLLRPPALDNLPMASRPVRTHAYHLLPPCTISYVSSTR